MEVGVGQDVEGGPYQEAEDGGDAVYIHLSLMGEFDLVFS